MAAAACRVLRSQRCGMLMFYQNGSFAVCSTRSLSESQQYGFGLSTFLAILVSLCVLSAALKIKRQIQLAKKNAESWFRKMNYEAISCKDACCVFGNNPSVYVKKQQGLGKKNLFPRRDLRSPFVKIVNAALREAPVCRAASHRGRGAKR